ncbi:uncharacterized protein LOC141795529 isoform X2 [Halichoeres trimaculatus]|uniref:uncharacterized protein LOC141795529 isoform X2 n=1 Tax=Halichoeres trimaculatus TaxID=147232 RepID=UPI003D9E9FDB
MDLSSQLSFRSCVHLEVPLRSASSVVFLDKSLCIPLKDLSGRRGSQPTVFRSTFSVRLCGSSCRSSSSNNKSAKMNLGYGRLRSGSYKQNKHESNSNHCGVPPLKHRGDKVEKTVPACGVNRNAYGSDTQHRHGATSGLLSFRGPSYSHTTAGRQKGNADEAAFPVQSNIKQRQCTFNTHRVDSRTWSKQTQSNKTKEPHKGDSTPEPQKVFILENLSRPKADSLAEATQTLSLKEALELFRPDFISRSQGRVRRLEQRTMRRRALQESSPDLVQDLREEGCRQRKKCTTPDPLSDNLFKPRERSISGKEMQLRSRRIYNKLPEVTKKKEEAKKRAVSETNRLRAERLLDQILQR